MELLHLNLRLDPLQFSRKIYHYYYYYYYYDCSNNSIVLGRCLNYSIVCCCTTPDSHSSYGDLYLVHELFNIRLVKISNYFMYAISYIINQPPLSFCFFDNFFFSFFFLYCSTGPVEISSSHLAHYSHYCRYHGRDTTAAKAAVIAAI